MVVEFSFLGNGEKLPDLVIVSGTLSTRQSYCNWASVAIYIIVRESYDPRNQGDEQRRGL